MTFIESITTCFKKSFTIKGRACRSEYWWFQLLWSVCYFLLLLLSPAAEGSAIIDAVFWMIVGVMIISIIPLFTAAIRRLHDVDKSGAFLFFSIIPFIGSIIVLVALIPEGTKGKNYYGKNPLRKK